MDVVCVLDRLWQGQGWRERERAGLCCAVLGWLAPLFPWVQGHSRACHTRGRDYRNLAQCTERATRGYLSHLIPVNPATTAKTTATFDGLGKARRPRKERRGEERGTVRETDCVSEREVQKEREVWREREREGYLCIRPGISHTSGCPFGCE